MKWKVLELWQVSECFIVGFHRGATEWALAETHGNLSCVRLRTWLYVRDGDWCSVDVSLRPGLHPAADFVLPVSAFWDTTLQPPVRCDGLWIPSRFLAANTATM